MLLESLPLFPNGLFAWVFVLVLGTLLSWASLIDGKTLRIPNRLTLTLLSLGIFASALRLGWLGNLGAVRRVGLWPVTGPWSGAVGGLVFTVAGVLVGFGLLFLCWRLGTCQGGDVKLTAAVGAWLGPEGILLALAGTVLAVLLLRGIQVLGARWLNRARPARLAYAPALTLSVMVLLTWGVLV